MSLNLGIIPIILAGIINGSFIIPTKYIKQLSHERIWFFHSIIGVLILPWLALALIQPHIILKMLQLRGDVLFYMTLSGLLFGMGQIVFSYSIAFIGIGLSFSINLGLGMALGSMFVVMDQHAMLSWHGFMVSSAILLILLGLIINYHTQKHSSVSPVTSHQRYRLGWLLAIIVGIISGLQNITFIVLAVNHSSLGIQANPFWIWPPFLTAAALPMLIGFWYRSKHAKANFNSASTLNFSSLLLIVVMGLFFVGSLVLYSEGMYILPQALHVIGWPLFMVLIIFTSQTWGWIYREFRNRRGMVYSSILFLVAIMMLATLQ